MSSFAQALQSNIQSDFTYRFSHRVFRNTNLSALAEAEDHLTREVVSFNLTQENFSFEFRPEVRYLWSYGLGLSEDDPAYVASKAPVRFMQLQHQWIKRNPQLLVTDIERMAFGFQNETAQIKIGRAPLALGLMKVLPLWNKFSPALINTPGNDIVYNPDHAQLKLQIGNLSTQLLDIEAQKPEDRVFLLNPTWYSDFAELQMVLASWWQRQAAGFGFSKDLGGVTVRGESFWIQKNLTSQNELQVALGAEYVFTQKLSASLEFAYFREGAQNRSEYFALPASPFRQLLANKYLWIESTYQYSDFGSLKAGGLVNLIDHSVLGNIELSYSLSDHSDLALLARFPTGGSNQEFGYLFLDSAREMYVGYPEKYSLQFKHLF